MSRKTPPQSAPVAVDLRMGPMEQVALDRLSGAPLTFSGRRISLHTRPLSWGDSLSIGLWQKQKSGHVIGFDVFAEGRVRTHAVVMESVEDAICFLEDHCTRLPEIFLQADHLAQSLLVLHRAMAFRAAFLTLVGDALADWVDLPSRPGRRHQDKATA